MKYTTINDLQKLLKHVMIDSDLTNNELAERCGKSKQAMSNLLRQDNISINQLKSICDAMGCELHIDIIPESGERG